MMSENLHPAYLKVECLDIRETRKPAFQQVLFSLLLFGSPKGI